MKSRCLFILFVLSIAYLFSARATPAKDVWTQVRSKNFLLIGNAAEKDIRKVGIRLEQFRETFRLLFTKMNLTSPILTNVIVFKNAASYDQFKPKRSDGKIDTFVAGYFQPGEDVNYITLSAQREDSLTFGVIFHEYVHSIINTNFGKSEVPPWFNEGLAEYYETFVVENDQRVKLGIPQSRHLLLLQQNKLTPLESLFSVTNTQLSNSGDHSRSIFYAESWALIHYLIEGGKTDDLGKFLDLLLGGMTAKNAFQTAFQKSYADMESELRNYVSLNQYHFREFTFNQKLNFETEMQSSPLDDASMNVYLGDLLAHIHREDDAEPFLQAALKLQPSSGMANTTLGMVRLQQRRFDDARQCLELAIASDKMNYKALFEYAYLLSRDGRDEFGFVRSLPRDTAEKMRDALRKAIAINPTYAPSYELLAFVDLVNNEFLDRAVDLMKEALKLQPGNQTYGLRLAEIYISENKFEEASSILKRIAQTTDVAELKTRSENQLDIIRKRQEYEAQRAEEHSRSKDRDADVVVIDPLTDQKTDKPMTELEIAKANAESKMRSINGMLRRPRSGEDRVLGHLQRVDCRTRPIGFIVKTQAASLTLTSKDFQALELGIFLDAKNKIQIGCDSDLTAFNALITFRSAGSKPNAKELVALEFVPADFRLMSFDELNQPPPRIVSLESIDSSGAALNGTPPPERALEFEKARREAILGGIKKSLRQPGDGEKREIGFLDQIECSELGVVFDLRTATQTFRLRDAIPKSEPVRIFTPDLNGIRIDCTLKPVEYPAVFIYKEAADPRTHTAGTLQWLSFVPKSFVLN